MNLKKNPELPRDSEAGFTLIEVMVSLAMLSIMGFSIWAAFGGGLRILNRIPEVGEANMAILRFEQHIKGYLNRVIFPYWTSELEDIDEDEPIIPYFYGYKDFKLYFTEERTEDLDTELYYLVLKAKGDFDDDMAVQEEFRATKETPMINRLGPFREISYEIVTDEDDHPIGINITVIPEKEAYGEISIFGKFGGEPFWVE